VLASKVDGVVFPTGNWWVLLFWMTPPVLILAISVILHISSRVTSGAAAQQAASVISLPLVVVAYGVSSNALFDTPELAWIVGAIAWVAALTAITVCSRALPRERLLGLGG
jgi:hypothetical protein